ncbi:hypothetical protein PO909_010262, partial [Leuciscus waleckii]
FDTSFLIAGGIIISYSPAGVHHRAPEGRPHHAHIMPNLEQRAIITKFVRRRVKMANVACPGRLRKGRQVSGKTPAERAPGLDDPLEVKGSAGVGEVGEAAASLGQQASHPHGPRLLSGRGPT